MKKLKVLFVTNNPFGMSSYGVVARNMIKAMPEYEWYVLSRQWKDPAKVFLSGNTQYLLIPSSEGDGYCFDSFLRICETIDPDYVITLGDVGVQYGYAVQIKNHWKGKKLKWFAYTPCDTDWMAKELITNLQRIEEIGGTIVAMSKFGQAKFKELAGVKAEMVYHGVDIMTFYPMPLTEKARLRKQMGLTGKFVAFTNSNNQDRKQLVKLIEAFSIAKIPNKFLILHTDMLPTENFGGIEIADYCKHMGLNTTCALTQRVQYPGWRNEWPDHRMNEMYNIADVFIFNGSEGFGLPILESQAAETPVLAGDITTMSELIPKENLIKRGSWHYASRTRYGVIDVNEMAKALEKMSKTLRSKIAINPQNDIKKNWTWEEVCKGWKKLLK